LLETIGWSVLIHVQDIDRSRSRDQLHHEASPRAIDYAAGRGPARGNRGCAKLLQLYGGLAAAKLNDSRTLQRALSQ
jgi:hypothetical protein